MVLPRGRRHCYHDGWQVGRSEGRSGLCSDQVRVGCRHPEGLLLPGYGYREPSRNLLYRGYGRDLHRSDQCGRHPLRRRRTQVGRLQRQICRSGIGELEVHRFRLQLLHHHRRLRSERLPRFLPQWLLGQRQRQILGRSRLQLPRCKVCRRSRFPGDPLHRGHLQPYRHLPLGCCLRR